MTASVRIVGRFQDTAGVQTPPRQKFPLACWNARKICVRQVADGWNSERSGTALLRGGVCTMFREGVQESVHGGRLLLQSDRYFL